MKPRPCEQCGAAFIPNALPVGVPPRRFCSPRCRKRAQGRRTYQRIANAQRARTRARRRAVLPCVHCRGTFRARNKRGRVPKYCSARCRALATKHPPPFRCTKCGAPTQGYLCGACHHARGPNLPPCPDCGGSKARASARCIACEHARRAVPLSVCLYCGKSYKPRGRKYVSYCSRAHAFAYWRERGRLTIDTVVRRAERLILWSEFNAAKFHDERRTACGRT